MSELMLDVGQANELKLAFRRHDYSSAEVKQLSEGEILGKVRGVLHGTHRIVEVPLLAFVRTFASTNARPTITSRGENLRNWFDGVSEGECSLSTTLHRLGWPSFNASIIVALDGKEKAEVLLADFYAALAEKEAAKDFTTLVCYVKDKYGKLRAVSAVWFFDGWNVHANSIDFPIEWNDGSQILSRNS